MENPVLVIRIARYSSGHTIHIYTENMSCAVGSPGERLTTKIAISESEVNMVKDIAKEKINNFLDILNKE